MATATLPPATLARPMPQKSVTLVETLTFVWALDTAGIASRAAAVAAAITKPRIIASE
ncbi:hypothetical protein D3C80_1844370 [compost metagenome]